MSCAALIVAAGRGERFGADLPKQYADLAGAPVLRRAVRAFLGRPGIGQVRVVIDPAHDELYRGAVGDLGLPPPVTGGPTRQESTWRGLEALAADAPAAVLIHDAARPLASPALIGRVLEALDRHDAALPVLPVVDSLKLVQDDMLAGDRPRDGLARAQTPQGFRFELILEAHRRHAGAAMTDDTALVAAMGVPVRAVAGEERNLKITTPDDMEEAKRRLSPERRWRTATGFDVHRLVPGRRLVLGGIDIPHELGLDGHSDADVVLHALTDALLGCIAAGDIGMHFPPSDPQWAGVASDRFLAHARDLVAGAGGTVEHVDVTILCERPKIGPHRDAMRARIAAILGLAVDRVSVKATTTERLGFTGRGEGIAAQATATVALDG
ncbi:MAG TPA: bifunctional 2-C-methyl-D-erythritol 4-phosphate cytidylyltransferase/2-C-methyl-D-erythritol 2,4-cyclodiphosphate synthase [Geminicoccaceae bacterium]|nr:bifunctional 2-C-methyl-D-erythritol 4-phosphate cytidylyltransferase/2-C-methyl-D-erythritol 2,4-cyclodiphosphate synthase [Geminicoccus sp.]HMU50045.1 bifunctional 2-C-methyl-D-erythritol 4-phosphate cytidylyltransferase/2-C-methyl-D-erythritol 2,4-cyclodiphosphate synthase [Geminicoccaceae bacterium]